MITPAIAMMATTMPITTPGLASTDVSSQSSPVLFELVLDREREREREPQLDRDVLDDRERDLELERDLPSALSTKSAISANATLKETKRL